MRRETLRRKVEVQIGQRKRLRFNRPEEKQSTGGNYQEKGGRVRGRKKAENHSVSRHWTAGLAQS